MKVKSKSLPPKEKVPTALFHQVADGTKIKYQGQEMIKFGPKKAMTSTGKVSLISDSTTVELVKES